MSYTETVERIARHQAEQWNEMIQQGIEVHVAPQVTGLLVGPVDLFRADGKVLQARLRGTEIWVDARIMRTFYPIETPEQEEARFARQRALLAEPGEGRR